MIRLALAAAVLCTVMVALARPLGWSLAGSDLVTYEDTGSNNQLQLFAMDLQRGLTATFTDGRMPNASRPLWSPDGRLLAFVSLDEPYISNAGNIFVIDMDTNAQRRVALQELASWETFIQTLAWSPDGAHLAVVGLIGSAWGLFVADVNTGDLRQVSDTAGAQVVWSPDGRQIAMNVFGANRGLYVVNANGSNLRLRVEDTIWIGSQAWSPDGNRIVYSSLSGIHVVTIDGENITQQRIRSTGYLPAWSPDGTRIAFAETGLRADLYSMNPDGSDAQRLLVGGSDWFVHDLAWSPNGRRLAMESECAIGGDDLVLDLCLYVVNAECISLPEGCDSHARRIAIQVDPQFIGRFVWWP
jgi:Tol biopolymer transport system component